MKDVLNKKKGVCWKFADYLIKLTQSVILFCLQFYLENIHTQKHTDQTFLTSSIPKKRNNILLVNNVLSTKKENWFIFG